jgi:hypothetical protein
MRPQTLQERLMPCTQFEALKGRQQARCDRGVDSDESTTQDEEEDKDEDEDDPQEEAAPLKARIRTTTVDMFKQVLLFSQGTAEALYNDQMITTLDVFRTSLMTSSRSSAVPSGSREGMDQDTRSRSFP